ncbi:MAG: TetR/AcrR family transcriptional regulator C-terminal domain-containing protein [Acidimicrobiia bacterium]
MTTTKAKPPTESRDPLTRDKVLLAAVETADQGGVASLTMRNLATVLGVEAMSLYYHVANKEAVLDGIVEQVLAELNEATAAEMPSSFDWKIAVRERILTARQVLLRHPWAPAVIETRTRMSPPILAYYEELLGLMRRGGFSYDLAHHAIHALGSRALGFTQELFEPDDVEAGEEVAGEMLEQMATELPNLMEMMMEIGHDDPGSTLGWCDDQTEFEFGLDLILDGLDRLREKPEALRAPRA